MLCKGSSKENKAIEILQTTKLNMRKYRRIVYNKKLLWENGLTTIKKYIFKIINIIINLYTTEWLVRIRTSSLVLYRV